MSSSDPNSKIDFLDPPEAVRRKEVRVRAVPDVRPVEEVSIVADLDVTLSALPCLEEPGEELAVSRPAGMKR